MEVVTLNQKKFEESCGVLFSMIKNKPDLVVGILEGGGYVVNRMIKESKIDSVIFKSVKLQRDNPFKNSKIIKFFLKVLPYIVLNKIRVFESKKAKESIDKINLSEILKCEINVDSISNIINVEQILIIDDAIDTGKTMSIVKNNLSKIFPGTRIEIAVISWTLTGSIIKPDYYLYKEELVRFPWAKDYKGKDFEKKCFSS
ncbi:hypoxanthine phosphoribosyltransferase [Seonamhaeicola aphaedonensis]|uniref:Hypoxanthine phosphoribosyltransferase n=2 Tax=Seonamhaeicola aphaedonensis TaxID=1461338 RepID=A0A3D9HG06_9FLAO|nr:hypoxanthine phosphoribosyltransferase [Seonamhaeicola aphaedonensis]